MSLLLGALIAISVWVWQAQAAEINAVAYNCFFFDKCGNSNPDSILIRGMITKGDAEAFHAAVNASDVPLAKVILRSNGGNVQEAMQIGRDVRRLLLETEGPYLDYLTASDGTLGYGGGDFPECIENGIGEYKGSRYKGSECVCASACFLIYVAGVRRDRSYVGIHRIYLSDTASQNIDLNAASQLYATAKKQVADYLSVMGVPHRYSDIMLRTSSKEIYVPKFPEIMADFYGWIPEVEEWLISKCKTLSDRQMEKEKDEAFNRGKILEFLELRERREACIQRELTSERDKRRKE